jgi:hypothetical protein
MSLRRSSTTLNRSLIRPLGLPTELIIEIMTHLDRVGLESLPELLHIPLAGVVQYASGQNVVSPRERKGMRSMSLSDLSDNRSIINIVDIVGMELLNNTLISEMCKALSKSINHITISQIEMSPFHNEFINGRKNRIFTLINSLPVSTQIVIRDSEFVGLNDGNIDLGRISFKSVVSLELQRCVFKGGTKLEIENVGELVLMEYSNEMIDSIDLEGGNINAFYAWGAAVKLENRTINTQEFGIFGGLDLQNVKFTGKCASFSSASGDFPLNIKGLDAPNLNELSISFREESPPCIDLNAPLLHRVALSGFGTVFGAANVREYDEDDFLFLREIKDLKLSHFFEPLHKIDLHNLTKLSLECNRKATHVERVFPSLKELVVFLSFCPEQVPLIKAENLESLEITVGRKFKVDSIIPTVRRYPKLEVFSFRNCGCSFLTRRRVEIMIYWMRWRTPCNLKEVRCGKWRVRCGYCFWGLFGL